MSAVDSYEQAEDYFKDENYAAAAQHYDKAVELAPGNAKYLANRANNFLKLKKYDAALKDTEAALKIDPKNGRALFRQGLALFYLDRFAEAQKSLEEAAAAGQEKTELWIRKCKAELERAAAGPSVVATAAAPAPVVHKIEALPPAKKEEKPAPVLPKPPANLAERTREQWFQSPADVTLTLLAKNLQKEQVDIQLDEATNELKATLTFPSDSSKFERHWKLWGQVSGHTVTITPYKVEIVLVKKGDGSWDSLERKVGEEVAPIVKRENVMREDINYAAYPTSSKTIKNWEELEKSAKKAEEEEKPEGEAALQKLFQSIYSGADEDTRRAMVKSFQTSGGTVLSTNWKEVKEKDYTTERQAPAGQEMVDWNSKTKGAL